MDKNVLRLVMFYFVRMHIKHVYKKKSFSQFSVNDAKMTRLIISAKTQRRAWL